LPLDANHSRTFSAGAFSFIIALRSLRAPLESFETAAMKSTFRPGGFGSNALLSSSGRLSATRSW
jgi:hypothetical protein